MEPSNLGKVMNMFQVPVVGEILKWDLDWDPCSCCEPKCTKYER